MGSFVYITRTKYLLFILKFGWSARVVQDIGIYTVLGISIITLITGTQVCHNCGIGTNCSVEINITWEITRDTECWELCINNTDCQAATLNSSSACMLYTCTQISQRIGSKAYRKTSNTDCLDYEIYVYHGNEGNCPTISTDNSAYSKEYCLERCLETPNCRGTTYDETNAMCLHHDNMCYTVDYAENKTYVRRVCNDEHWPCNRIYTQKCVNCMTGSYCQPPLRQNSLKKPLSIDTSALGVDPDIQQIWYNAKTSTAQYIQCPYVIQGIGDTIYRATCTQDCPTFELLTLLGHKGTCPFTEKLGGGVTLEFCMSKCLDLENCRGVTFDKALMSCTFHECTTYTSSTGYDFIARRCINTSAVCSAASMVIQTCYWCSPGPNCPQFYMSNNQTALYTECHDIKASDNESVMVHYKRYLSRCDRYQCSQVQQKMGQILYRQSCNTDCPEFEIYQISGQGGTCDVIQSEEGGLTFNYCVEKCLDITGCKGTTFHSTTGRCDYHDCANYTVSPGLRFMWKRCIDFYPPPGEYRQICAGCLRSDVCQKRTSEVYSPTWQQCRDYYNDTDVGMHQINRIYAACKLNNCTWLKQDKDMHHMAFRRSYTPDCPIYRLFTLYGYAGTCPVIGYTEGGVSLDYCVDKCLDIDGCRAVSHQPFKLHCLFHNCTDREVDGRYNFVKRVCITYEELVPIQNFTQTCRNCNNTCSSSLSTQSNVYVSSACDTNCDGCENIMYDALSNTCRQYQCDRPYGLGIRTQMIRKTSNPVCRNFRLVARTGSFANCEAFDYDEGVENIEYCLMRCFDLRDCMSVVIDIGRRNCTYHMCIEYVPGDVLGYFVEKDCYSECSSPTTQLCLNCQEGTTCQSSFNSTYSYVSSSCRGMCDTEPSCEVALYNETSSECQLFQCSYVTQKYNSTVFRKSCNQDCPVYEVYILDGNVGTCDVIETMTEYFVMHEEFCHRRCLDTAGCRGVTYLPTELKCIYHYCDCHVHISAQPAVFWWIICLENASQVTVLPTAPTDSPLTNSDIFPSVSNCKPSPIFILPCQCSTGEFLNLTNEEIIYQLVTHMAIDVESTSANLRKFTSAEDNRKSAIAIGSVGAGVLIAVAATIVLMDFANVIKSLQQLYRNIRKMPKKSKMVKKNKLSLTGEASFDSIESLQHNYACEHVCKEDIEKTDDSHRRLSIESIH